MKTQKPKDWRDNYGENLRLTYHWSNENDEGCEVIAASRDVRRLNALMRGDIEQSGVLAEDMKEVWDEDESEFLDYDNDEQCRVCYAFYCSPCNYLRSEWEIIETEVK